MKIVKQLLITIAVLLCSTTMYAYDFEVDGIYYNILSMDDLTVEVTFKYSEQIGPYEYIYESDYIGDIVIPSAVTVQSKTLTVTTIDSYAFYKCTDLTSVIIPNSIINIEDRAFYQCSNLESAIIGNNVTNIGNEVFYACSNLTDIVIPDNVTNIGFGAFDECRSLKNVILSNRITEIRSATFRGCNLTNITIPNSVISIHSVAFVGNNITCVTIPNSVMDIGISVFSSIKDLIIEDGSTILSLENVIGMSSDTFGSCENIYLGRNIEGSYPFKEDLNLKNITFGNTVTSIREEEFNGCDSLANIYLMGTNPPSVGDNNFTNAHYINTNIYVPKGYLTTYQEADIWKLFWNIQEHELAASIEDIESETIDFTITSNGISLSNANNSTVAIYSINGVLVKRIDKYAGEEITLEKGVYIVSVGNKAVKIKL